MAGMYGADVEQLRALARSFDSAATRLDSDRLSVGNAIRINAWVGPVAVRFRAEWDSAHSVKVARAAVRLHAAASTLRSNADDQERTSAVSGASPGASGGGWPAGLGPTSVLQTGFSLGGVLAFAGDSARNAWSALSSTVSSADLATGISEKVSNAAHILLSGRGLEDVKNYTKVVESTKFGHLLGVAGSTIGVISVGVGAVETVMAARDGDVAGATWMGAKTIIGLAALIPSPIAPIAAGLGLGIGVGELLSQNPAITKFAGDVAGPVWDAASSTVSHTLPIVTQAVQGAVNATGQFLGGLAESAKKFWSWRP